MLVILRLVGWVMMGVLVVCRLLCLLFLMMKGVCGLLLVMIEMYMFFRVGERLKLWVCV